MHDIRGGLWIQVVTRTHCTLYTGLMKKCANEMGVVIVQWVWPVLRKDNALWGYEFYEALCNIRLIKK